MTFGTARNSYIPLEGLVLEDHPFRRFMARLQIGVARFRAFRVNHLWRKHGGWGGRVLAARGSSDARRVRQARAAAEAFAKGNLADPPRCVDTAERARMLA